MTFVMIGLLFGIAAATDIWIIFQNPDYRLNVFCSRPTGCSIFSRKSNRPCFIIAIGYGFFRLLKWSLFAYLTYAGDGLLNAMINWIRQGYGRIRSVFSVSLLILYGLYPHPEKSVWYGTIPLSNLRPVNFDSLPDGMLSKMQVFKDF